MNRQPPQPLDAEERALAAQLPRAPGRNEPGAEIDARILAAAQAAVQAPAGKARRRSWIAPMSVAASLMLAIGLAWQLRPSPVPQVPAPAAEAASTAGIAENADVAAVRAVEAPATPMTKPVAASVPRVATAPSPVEIAPAPMAAPAAPPPPPPPPPAPVMAEIAAPVATAQTAESAAAPAPVPAMAKAGVIDSPRARAAPERVQRDAAAMAADAVAGETDDPGTDVPPATADSPDVRDAWLRRIGELLKQGKQDEAKASLAEFRRRYPDAELPKELLPLTH